MINQSSQILDKTAIKAGRSYTVPLQKISNRLLATDGSLTATHLDIYWLILETLDPTDWTRLKFEHFSTPD
jgi:hypothetical protein